MAMRADGKQAGRSLPVQDSRLESGRNSDHQSRKRGAARSGSAERRGGRGERYRRINECGGHAKTVVPGSRGEARTLTSGSRRCVDLVEIRWRRLFSA